MSAVAMADVHVDQTSLNLETMLVIGMAQTGQTMSPGQCCAEMDRCSACGMMGDWDAGTKEAVQTSEASPELHMCSTQAATVLALHLAAAAVATAAAAAGVAAAADVPAVTAAAAAVTAAAETAAADVAAAGFPPAVVVASVLAAVHDAPCAGLQFLPAVQRPAAACSML